MEENRGADGWIYDDIEYYVYAEDVVGIVVLENSGCFEFVFQEGVHVAWTLVPSLLLVG